MIRDHMKAFLITLLLTGMCHAQSLFWISEVGDKPGPDYEEMTLKRNDATEALFVKKTPVVEDTDIEDAYIDYSPGAARSLIIKFNKAGGEKVKEATARLSQTNGRMAMVLEGTVISAPVVMATISGGSLSVVGLKDFDDKQLAQLVAKLLKKPLPATPQLDRRRPLPLKTEPYTDEEYAAIKAQREKMGVFYLDEMPGQEELDSKLRKGMSPSEVETALGMPASRSDFFWIYEVAEERLPEVSNGKPRPTGLIVTFDNRKVSRWDIISSTLPQRKKAVGQEPPTLLIAMPRCSNDITKTDWIQWFEAIDVHNPEQTVNKTDLGQLLSITMQLVALMRVEPDRVANVSAACDMVRTLAHNFPEVEALRMQSPSGRILLEAIEKALMPYLSGDKPLPVTAPAAAR